MSFYSINFCFQRRFLRSLNFIQCFGQNEVRHWHDADKAIRLLFRLHCIPFHMHCIVCHTRHVSIDTFHELFVRSSVISSQASVNISNWMRFQCHHRLFVLCGYNAKIRLRPDLILWNEWRPFRCGCDCGETKGFCRICSSAAFKKITFVSLRCCVCVSVYCYKSNEHSKILHCFSVYLTTLSLSSTLSRSLSLCYVLRFSSLSFQPFVMNILQS